MRWKATGPLVGETRVITRFAWWPTILDEGFGVVVWLERYAVHQTYDSYRAEWPRWVTQHRTVRADNGPYHR